MHASVVVIIRKSRISAHVSAAASSPPSYLRHLRPPQGKRRADDDRKSAETDWGQPWWGRGRSGGGERGAGGGFSGVSLTSSCRAAG